MKRDVLGLFLGVATGIVAGTAAGWYIGADNPVVIASASSSVIVVYWLGLRKKKASLRHD